MSYQDNRNNTPKPPQQSLIPYFQIEPSKNPEIFNETAEQVAKILTNTSSGEQNKSTQLRSFYDELVLWEQKSQKSTNQNEFKNQILPYVKMMNAKAAYAEGRKLVNFDFTDWLSNIIKQINTPETLTFAKLHFEAVLGFRKGMEEKNK